MNKRKGIDWQEIHRKLETAANALTGQPGPSEGRRVLKARAAELAREPQKGSRRVNLIEVVEFSLAHERYAFESSYVREICPLNDLTPVPCTPPFVLGIINLRGQILSVIDLKRFFGLPERGITDLNKVMVLTSAAAGGAMEFGVLADSIIGAMEADEAKLVRGLPTFTGIREEYLKGITPDRVAVIDASRLLSDPSIVVRESEA